MPESDSQPAPEAATQPGVTRFDPYASWLDLPDKPATYYQLLAVDPQSSTAEVEAAAAAQLAKLRKHQLGPHHEAATQLSNEVSTACDVLTDHARREAYDQQLKNNAPTSTSSDAGTTSDGSQPPIPDVPSEAEVRQQLLICPVCYEWWMVSPRFAGRQILCVGCQTSLQVSPDMINLTVAPQPPPQPQPPPMPAAGAAITALPLDEGELPPINTPRPTKPAALELWAALLMMLIILLLYLLGFWLLYSVVSWFFYYWLSRG